MERGAFGGFLAKPWLVHPQIWIGHLDILLDLFPNLPPLAGEMRLCFVFGRESVYVVSVRSMCMS